MPTVNYTPLATARRFMLSEAAIKVLIGARGSGKSTAMLMEVLRESVATEERFWPLRWAVVRDTRANLGRTFARSIRQWLPEPYAHLKGKDDEPDGCDVYIGTKKQLRHVAHLDFFGVNSAADHSRFQSYEASGGIVMEEPCPLKTNTEAISSGIQESVLSSAMTCLRAGPNPRVLIASNPPSGDHWLCQLFHLSGWEIFPELEGEMSEEQRAARARIRAASEVFVTPQEECAAELVTPGYRARMRDALMATGDMALVARLVEGRTGSVDVGVRVTPEFHGGHIVAQLPVMANVPAVLAFDYGLNPTCIVAQVTPQGYLNVLRAWSRQNVGMKQLLEQDVQPWLAQSGLRSWWYCGGAEAREREQSDSEESALKVILRTLGAARYQAAPVSWSARRQALKEALTRSPGGFPWVRVSQEGAALLIRCLDGGWAYATDASEQVRNETVPPKNRYSHLGDAMCALAAVLLRKTDPEERRATKRTPAVCYPALPASWAQGQTRTRV